MHLDRAELANCLNAHRFKRKFGIAASVNLSEQVRTHCLSSKVYIYVSFFCDNYRRMTGIERLTLSRRRGLKKERQVAFI